MGSAAAARRAGHDVRLLDLQFAADAAVALKNTTLADGTPAKKALAKTVQILLDPARMPGLTYRDGRNYSLTTDGKEVVMKEDDREIPYLLTWQGATLLLGLSVADARY